MPSTDWLIPITGATLCLITVLGMGLSIIRKNRSDSNPQFTTKAYPTPWTTLAPIATQTVTIDDFSARSTVPAILLTDALGMATCHSLVKSVIEGDGKRLLILVDVLGKCQPNPYRDWWDQLAKDHKNLLLVDRQLLSMTDTSLTTRHRKSTPNTGLEIDAQMLRRLFPSWNCQFFVSGSVEFQQAIFEQLIDSGAGSHQVYRLTDGTANSLASPAVPSEACRQVQLGQSDSTAAFNGDQSLLEVLESAGARIDSGCQTGNCGACLTRIISGHVRYPNRQIPEVGAQECFPCIAVPASDDLRLDVWHSGNS